MSWQTDQLYRVEDARRRLAAARKEAREVAEIREGQYVRQKEREARRRQVEEWRQQDERRLAVVRGHGGYKARDRWIRDRRVEGMSLREIAKGAALSVERVQQIWRRRRDRPWLRYAALALALIGLPLSGALAQQKTCDQFRSSITTGTMGVTEKVPAVVGKSIFLCGYLILPTSGGAGLDLR